jgi:hypothetical protein
MRQPQDVDQLPGLDAGTSVVMIAKQRMLPLVSPFSLPTTTCVPWPAVIPNRVLSRLRARVSVRQIHLVILLTK